MGPEAQSDSTEDGVHALYTVDLSVSPGSPHGPLVLPPKDIPKHRTSSKALKVVRYVSQTNKFTKP